MSTEQEARRWAVDWIGEWAGAMCTTDADIAEAVRVKCMAVTEISTGDWKYSVQEWELGGPIAFIQSVKENLASYKAPKHIVRVDLLQRHANGKSNYRWATATAEKAIAD